MPKLTPKFTGQIEKGQLKLDSQSKFLTYLQQLGDCKVDLSVKKHRKQRSINQNRLYWSYLNLIEDETGDNANDLHSYFKRKHLTPKFINVLNQTVKIPKSTSDLSTGEFGEYLDKIELECGVPIPDINLLMMEEN